MNMKKLGFALSICLMLTNLVAQAQEMSELIRKAKDKLAQVKDYEANAILKLNVSFLQVPDSKVVVYYKQPDKFRIVQQKGISIVPRGGVSINLNAILNEKEYTAVDAGSASINGKELRIIKLLPHSEESEVVLSTMYIDPQTYLVKKLVTTTKENGSYTIEFKYGKFSNWALPDELLFSFNTKDYKLPKGMTFDYENEIKADTTGLKSSKGEVRIVFDQYAINKGVKDEVFH
jgi:outer membrane lipoprotein-sorting protein